MGRINFDKENMKRLNLKNPLKIGGGGKLQPFIPKGKGEKSGEYTSTETGSSDDEEFQRNNKHLNLINPRKNLKESRYEISHFLNTYNLYHCKFVGEVKRCFVFENSQNLPLTFHKNSVVIKKVRGVLVRERYYDKNGNVYLDIDYLKHGNRKTHHVPHLHRWSVYSKNGKQIVNRFGAEEMK